MANDIIQGSEARVRLQVGINKIADIVKVTLGAGGRNVLLQKAWSTPHVTKDGVTIAGEVDLKDPIEATGANLVKQAARRTVEEAGDGTTTAVLLTQAIFNAAYRNIVAGADPMQIKRGIERLELLIQKQLKEDATPITPEKGLLNVALVSANNDELVANTIIEVFKQVGRDGVVTVEETPKPGLKPIFQEGIKFERGYISPHFINTKRMTCEIKDCRIIFYDGTIRDHTEITPILDKMVKAGLRNVLFIADDIEGNALPTLILNKLNKTLNVAAIKAPAYAERRKETMKDLAVATGGTFISKETGLSLEEMKLEDLGTAERVIIDRDYTTILDGRGRSAEVSERIEQIKIQIENEKSTYDQERMKERLAMLSSKTAIIEVGASTEAELKELKDRLDDALQASRAALDEGVVPGGGIELFNISELLFVEDENLSVDEQQGIQILRNAIREPLRQIVSNAGYSPEVVIDNIKRKRQNGYGLNTRTGEYIDMVKFGIVDPVKVTRLALEHAVSIAVLLLTSEGIVYEIPEERKEDNY